jgi:hypothetical protein
MNGFKKCDNGHFYKEDLTACPYCPSGSSASSNAGGNDLNNTIVAGGGNTSAGNDNAKTQVFGSQSGNDGSDQTKVFGSGNAAAPGQPKRDLNRTYIAGVTDEDTTSASGSGATIDATPRSTRRIVGWILSYTLDPMGVDYRIYEGNNSIGRDAGNSITITKDTTISGKHANILYKKGKFYIKDEMAANGTFVNDEELEIEKAYPLNDGDVIRLANTTFIFKCSEILEKH